MKMEEVAPEVAPEEEKTSQQVEIVAPKEQEDSPAVGAEEEKLE